MKFVKFFLFAFVFAGIAQVQAKDTSSKVVSRSPQAQLISYIRTCDANGFAKNFEQYCSTHSAADIQTISEFLAEVAADIRNEKIDAGGFQPVQVHHGHLEAKKYNYTESFDRNLMLLCCASMVSAGLLNWYTITGFVPLGLYKGNQFFPFFTSEQREHAIECIGEWSLFALMFASLAQMYIKMKKQISRDIVALDKIMVCIETVAAKLPVNDK